MDYEWITFDCYGTLIDWEGGISAAFEKIGKASGNVFDRNRILTLYRKYEAEEEFSYKRYREILNRVARRVCAELGWKVPDYSFLSESLPRWRPFADTSIALQRLARKHRLGILSNVDNDLLVATQRHFPVTFQLVVTAEQVASYKPNPAHFHEAKRKIGQGRWIHTAQSLFHDIAPCNRLNIDTAWINRNQEVNKDEKIKPVYTCRDLIQFANWIEGVDQFLGTGPPPV